MALWITRASRSHAGGKPISLQPVILSGAKNLRAEILRSAQNDRRFSMTR
jgi:hypothetical protein